MTEKKYCPNGCEGYTEREKNGKMYLEYVHFELIKICPLGTDVGGFIWQCPICKTVVADWEELNCEK